MPTKSEPADEALLGLVSRLEAGTEGVPASQILEILKDVKQYLQANSQELASPTAKLIPVLHEDYIPSHTQVHKFVTKTQASVLVVQYLQDKQLVDDTSVVVSALQVLNMVCAAAQGKSATTLTAIAQARRQIKLKLAEQLGEGKIRQTLLNLVAQQGIKNPIDILPLAVGVLQWLLTVGTHATSVAAMSRLNGSMKGMIAIMKEFKDSPLDKDDPAYSQLMGLHSAVCGLGSLCEQTDQNLTALAKPAEVSTLTKVVAHNWKRAGDFEGAVEKASTLTYTDEMRGHLLVVNALYMCRKLCKAEAKNKSTQAFLSAGGANLLVTLLLQSRNAVFQSEALTLLTKLMSCPPVAAQLQADIQACVQGFNAESMEDLRVKLVTQVWHSCKDNPRLDPCHALQTVFVALTRFLGINDLPGKESETPRTWKVPKKSKDAPAEDYSRFSPELLPRSSWTCVLDVHNRETPGSQPATKFRHIQGVSEVPEPAMAASSRDWASEATEPFRPYKPEKMRESYDALLQRYLSDREHECVIYDRDDASINLSSPKGTPDPTWMTPGLNFNGRFECGNLWRVVRVGETQYDVILASDINSPGHVGQWFYFSAEGWQKDTMYTISIINMGKIGALFVQGQLPTMYSTMSAKETGKGWTRDPIKDVCYFRNPYVKNHTRNPTVPGLPVTFNTVQFRVLGQYDSDTVYLAYSHPYTYTEVQNFLSKSLTPEVERFCVPQVLAKTLGGNDVYLLTITQLDADSSYPPIRDRPIIAVSARVHPGETCASWMMEGLLKLLLDVDNPISQSLRRKYVWKIVPMLNPDGVIHGSTRCSLAGFDLNRKWLHPDPVITPSINHWREYMQHIHMVESRPILLFLDLHGHARAKNIFMYGCNGATSASTTEVTGKALPMECILPTLLSQQVPYFSALQSTYRVQKSREATGRVVGFKQCGITLSYTVEGSLCGGYGVNMPKERIEQWDPTQKGPGASYEDELTKWDEGHFGCQHYALLGMAIGKSVLALESTPTTEGTVREVVQGLSKSLQDGNEWLDADEDSDSGASADDDGGDDGEF